MYLLKGVTDLEEQLTAMWAHSANYKGEKHDLVDHILSTAELAEEFANEVGIEGFAYAAGLYHDIGKCHPSFQQYLEDPTAPRSVRDHSSAGAVKTAHLSPLGALCAFAVAGHHSGLSSRAALQERVAEKQTAEVVSTALQIGEQLFQSRGVSEGEIPTDFSEKWSHLVKSARTSRPRPESLEVWLRMLFSCLVDADYLDTEAHFNDSLSALRKSWHVDIETLWQRLTNYYAQLAPKDAQKRLNKARREVFASCVAAAEQKPGLFNLNAPTGMGKTLAGMGFALRHALVHQKKRVIVVVPYSSIIDQNAAKYKEIFGTEFVLEHHSSVEVAVADDQSETENKRKLAAENWDAPIIVTTTVQFFESLFANRTSAVRKLHRIANSVVVLDEVQMLPLELLQPIFSMMQELMAHYGVTFLMSSATPLATDLSLEGHALPRPTDVLSDADALFHEFRRVDYDLQPLREQWTWQRVADEVKQYRQMMVVVNRRSDARALFEKLQGRSNVLHLSAAMCAAHRKEVLNRVKEFLADQKDVVLVATQVVEAGVDIDFPVVMRALGPLDRIVQVAGRCNREDGDNRGKVIVFRPAEGGLPPGSYRTATKEAENMLLDDPEALHQLRTYERYFRKLYGSVDTDGKGVQALRSNSESALHFPQIAKRFRFIEDATHAVVVPYDARAMELLQQFEEKGYLTRTWMREIQPYVVNVHLNDSILAGEKKLVSLAEGWFAWKGDYDEAIGLALS